MPTVGLKLDEDELERLKALALEAGMSMSDFLRYKVLGVPPRTKRSRSGSRRRRRERAERAIGKEHPSSEEERETPDLDDFNYVLSIARVVRLPIERVRELIERGELKVMGREVVLGGRLAGKL